MLLIPIKIFRTLNQRSYYGSNNLAKKKKKEEASNTNFLFFIFDLSY